MSDYESWLVKREEKAERKNAVFWLIFSIIIIGIAMWCFVDTIREYQFSEKLLREGTCITAEYYEGHNAYQYFEAGKSRFAVCKKSIIYKDQGDTVKMYYTGDDFSQAVPLLADWVWITQFGIEIAVMFGELNGGDSMMETLGLQFKDKIYDDMKTDEHTDERMEALREQELRTKRRKKGLFSFLKRKK